MKCKVEKWSEELLLLSSIAQTHPQAAYATFTHCLASKWIYLTRTTENIGPLIQPLEDIIRTKFIPTLCGRPAPNDELRELLALPCRLDGLHFTVEHALSSPKGGYPSNRHNEIRDFTAHPMTEVCHNGAVEPHLQPLTGETLHGASSITQDGARLDVATDGFRFERAFFDVKVFDPYVPSNQRSTLQASYRKHENIKKRAYDQRVREVEHGTFPPLVFSCTGGMSRAATATYKRLAALIAEKSDEPYSTTMGWIRCHLSFSLLRASIMCFRGARSSSLEAA